MLVLSLSALGIFALCFGALGLSFGLLLLFRFLSGWAIPATLLMRKSGRQ